MRMISAIIVGATICAGVGGERLDLVGQRSTPCSSAKEEQLLTGAKLAFKEMMETEYNLKKLAKLSCNEVLVSAAGNFAASETDRVLAQRAMAGRSPEVRGAWNGAIAAIYPGSSFDCVEMRGSIRIGTAEVLYKEGGKPQLFRRQGGINISIAFLGSYRYQVSFLQESGTQNVAYLVGPNGVKVIQVSLSGGSVTGGSSYLERNKRTDISRNELIRRVQAAWDKANLEGVGLSRFSTILLTNRKSELFEGL